MCAAPAHAASTSALFEQKAFQHIVRAPDDGLLPLALFNREDGRQRIVLDLHRCYRLAQLVLVRMRQQHDRLVAMIHLAVGKARLIRKDELNMILPGNVGRGDDRELAPVDLAIEA